MGVSETFFMSRFKEPEVLTAEPRTRSDPDVVRPRQIDGTNWANK